ncbi:MAG: glycoside hydrolase family 2 TIM barrel-domain containing protein [Spirochaetota bacterium]
MPTENITSRETPRNVVCELRDGAYRIVVDGEEFFVKGAGGAHARIENLASHGANSLRTWSTANAREVLDAAQRSGMMVLMGLRMVPERHGFDYADESAVREQFEKVEAEVRAYKDHPALLAWGIGNELNLSYENPAVWDAANDVARMIHEVDQNHPATTMLAGVKKPVFDEIARLAPGESAFAGLDVEVAEGEKVSVHAEVLPEATVLGEGGDYEPRPEAVPGLVRATGTEEVEFDAPSEPGAYRLFVTILDDHNHAAVANIPFLVE